MKVPLLDLKAQYEPIRSEVEAAVIEVLEGQAFILGPAVQKCEEAVAKYCGSRYAVGVSSGTDALLCAMMAEGLGPGDEVITSPYTFFATVGCIARLGAKARFVDIDPETFNFRPELVDAQITPRTRGIIPVHLFGQMTPMEHLSELCVRHQLWLMEDAAQAIGTTAAGRQAGSCGKYGCFSFFPSKNLGAAGDAGLITTQDEATAQRLRILRSHGGHPKYFHGVVGGNFRLDSIQAAIVSVKLKYLDRWSRQRAANARRYDQLFTAAGLVPEPVTLPRVLRPQEPTSHIFNQYVIRIPQRDRLKQYLTEHGVGTEVYYPRPMHIQECFANLGYRQGDFPEAEKAADESLALPIFPELRDDQAEYVVNCIRDFVHQKGSRSS
jgi:dTDP-4-amino-4,6-dideoxygalactose transaminase